MSQTGYVKIYGSILGSSVWAESAPTRIVWITMLALADEHGHVEASVGGLSRFANVSPSKCRTAIEALSAPDPESKSPEWDGRRIEKESGGWLILNYTRYRELRSPTQIQTAERVQRWRDRQAAEREGTVTERYITPSNTEKRTTVAVAVAVKASSSPSSREELLSLVPKRHAWEAEIRMTLDGGRKFSITETQVEDACRDYLANGASVNPNLGYFRTYLQRAALPPKDAPASQDTQLAALDKWAQENP